MPLAERLRPQTLDSIEGQERILAPGRPLRKLIEADAFRSLILWGPPGTGKTTVATLMGKLSRREVRHLSAVHAGVKDIRAVLSESEAAVSSGGAAHVLFLDEIHRLTKSQQDVLLPALESGIVRFIGATTENPSFEVNSAINSRSLIFRFEALSTQGLRAVMQRALATDAALPRRDVSEAVLEILARTAAGDARRALGLLEAVLICAPSEASPITPEVLDELKDSLSLRYDKAGDKHYDTASALIKSIRASHPDAALYYMARMLAAGEDPMFIARRLVIAASEDIGNASPNGLVMATAGMQAVHMVGMPEARIILAQVVTFLAASPKSNRAYAAINAAMADVENFGDLEPPLSLRNAVTAMMREMGYGKGYAYAHDDREAARRMAYLPDALKGKRYYEPSEFGAEAQLKKNLDQLRPLAD